MDTNGYLIFENILPKSDYDSFERDFWEQSAYIIPGLDRADPKTWDFPRGTKGIIRSYGFPHLPCFWDIRTHPRIRGVFESMLGTDDLVVSFDSPIIKVNPTKWEPWFHRDQKKNWTEPSYQGIYYHQASGPKDPGTTLIPGSHLWNDDWDTDKDTNWIPAPKEIQNTLQTQSIKPDIPANSLLVFNSRVLHASTGGTHKYTDKLSRLSFCVSYTHKDTRPLSVLLEKKEAYKKGWGSAHWSGNDFRILRPGTFEHRKGLLKYLPPSDPIPKERLNLF